MRVWAFGANVSIRFATAGWRYRLRRCRRRAPNIVAASPDVLQDADGSRSTRQASARPRWVRSLGGFRLFLAGCGSFSRFVLRDSLYRVQDARNGYELGNSLENVQRARDEPHSMADASGTTRRTTGRRRIGGFFYSSRGLVNRGHGSRIEGARVGTAELIGGMP